MLTERQEQTSNIHYLTISNGTLVKKVDASTPKAIARVNKLGETVYESHYASIVGKIKNISVETNKYDQKQIRVTITDANNMAVLTFNYESSYGRGFLRQIFNADLTKNIIFAPWSKIADDGKKITRLYLSYGRNMNVESKFPDGTPEVEWLDLKGKKVPDTRSQIAFESFLEDALNKFIKEKGLEYSKSTNDSNSHLDVTITSPLTKEEKDELKSLKKNGKKKSVENEAGIYSSDDVEDMDDFWTK